jgi:hypothetical protein
MLHVLKKENLKMFSYFSKKKHTEIFTRYASFDFNLLSN